MSLHPERYFELVERMGGVNDEALSSFVYWNNPLALKHWTMNVVELLFIIGAALSLKHAIGLWRSNSDARPLMFIFAMFIYYILIEVPVYFPQLIGLPENIIFIHNEFSLGFVFNQTPLYIICLYPALLYASYLFVEKLGVFARYPVVVGAIGVGFVHSCFYEIFDHFGPQYNWWIWDYENVYNELLVGSVPLLSIANFSLIPPIAMTLLARALIFSPAGAQAGMGSLLLRSTAVGVATPLIMVLIAPTGIAAIITDSSTALTWVSWLTVAAAGIVTVIAFIQCSATATIQTDGLALGDDSSYPFNYFVFYLAVFAALWVYALEDYSAAIDGVVSIAGYTTYTGSLSYVVACYGFCFFFLLQLYKKQSRNSELQAQTV